MLQGATWPLLSNVIRRNSPNNTYGYVRRYSDGRPKPHQGWDFAARIGTPAYAVGQGEVVFVQDRGSYGIQMCMSFEAGGSTWYAFYAHMQNLTVSAGDKVKLDDYVGTTGESGNARGMAVADQHLHFEVRTQAHCGLGLAGRVSPLRVFGLCPLKSAIAG